jgi:outer membrane protein OmpA-like peptidoglycan-associated protein
MNNPVTGLRIFLPLTRLPQLGFCVGGQVTLIYTNKFFGVLLVFGGENSQTKREAQLRALLPRFTLISTNKFFGVIRGLKYMAPTALNLCGSFCVRNYLLVLIGFLYLPLCAQTPTSFKEASNLILEGSINTSSRYNGEMIEKNSNDAINDINFKSAINYWKKSIEAQPDNANFNYKLGLCYFFSYDQQLKALTCFKKAIKNLSGTYDFSNEKEAAAPYNAYYFLAETFLENNQSDSAFKYFGLYQDNHESSTINTELNLLMCVNAKEAAKNPRNVKVNNLGNAINTPFAETNPVMRLDNKFLFFSSRRPGAKETESTTEKLYNADIYFTIKNESGNWENPVPFAYNTEYDEAPLYLSPNGDVLYLRRNVKNNCDIFKSEYINKAWTKPKPVTEINTPFNETGISITSDGKYLYFCSDQNKESGKYDIFKCTKQSNGRWGQLELLSPRINSSFNQVSPYISPDGKTLFYSTNGSGQKGIGGYDIFYTELKSDDTWTEPNTMGYPINTSRDDINYCVASEDKRYYASLTENNSYDIFLVEGGGFDFENIAAGTDVVTVTNEMGVTQVVETEKSVEKEVTVTQAVETIVEVEKIVEVTKTLEPEKEKEETIASDADLKLNEADQKIIDQEINNITASASKVSISPGEMQLEKFDHESKIKMMGVLKRYLKVELLENEPFLYKRINFDSKNNNLSKQISKSELKLLLDFMKDQPNTKIELVGYTDNSGDWSMNNKLSTKRAEVVYNYLVSNGIAPKRIHYYGKGSLEPLVPNDTNRNRSKNRRVELYIIK